MVVVHQIMVVHRGRDLRVMVVLPATVARRVETVLLVAIALLEAVRLLRIVLRAGGSIVHRIRVLRIPGTGADIILITVTIIILTVLMYMGRPGIRLAFSLARLQPAPPSLR